MASPDSIVDLVVSTASGAAGLWASAADLAAWRAVEQAGSYRVGGPPPLGAGSGSGSISSWGGGGSFQGNPAPNTTYGMTAVEPGIPDVEDAYLTFEGQRDYLVGLMTDQLTKFFTAYYPLNEDGYDAGMAWLINTITVGGTGINPVVEDQIWQRGRDRIIAEGARQDSATLLQFSQRGFTLPSGVMVAQLQANRFEQFAKLQEQSRDVAIKQAEIEVENLRFAVDKVVTLRLQALQAAADYIRALMSGLEMSFRVVNLNSDAKAKMMAATADLYRARLQRDEIAMRVPFKDTDSILATNQMNMDGFYKGIDAKVRAAAAAADVYASMAQAGISALHAIGSSTIQAAG